MQVCVCVCLSCTVRKGQEKRFYKTPEREKETEQEDEGESARVEDSEYEREGSTLV